jgi:hypothetical protein
VRSVPKVWSRNFGCKAGRESPELRKSGKTAATWERRSAIRPPADDRVHGVEGFLTERSADGHCFADKKPRLRCIFAATPSSVDYARRSLPANGCEGFVIDAGGEWQFYVRVGGLRSCPQLESNAGGVVDDLVKNAIVVHVRDADRNPDGVVGECWSNVRLPVGIEVLPEARNATTDG